ncbi:flagellar hook-length control protein FliK [Rhodopila sp.]|uniref:flagellar hook-length control protein FliK n=1 Tax=Rhodopila sp. TaxID=2480087 RepID=UPI003D0C5170
MATSDAPATPAPAERLDGSGQTTASEANQRLAAPAADIAGLAAQPPAPASDHKITLRPAEIATDPAQPDGQSNAPSAAVLAQAPPVTPAIVTTVTATTAPAQAHPATPTEQLAPALLTLAKTADGGQQMTVRLQPGDLGMVQVRIDRSASGHTQIEITADNPNTLLALQRDQPQLHRTLDEAGIPATGRNVSFHAAAMVQAAAGSNAGASPGGHGNSQPGSSSGSSGFGSSGRGHSGMSDAGGSTGGRGGYATRERGAYAASRQTGATPAAGQTAVASATQSYRIGLDITA